jgi:hypothetical protein
MLKSYFSSKVQKLPPLNALLIVGIVAGLGIYLLVGSHAATPNAGISASDGTVSNGAAVHTDSSANNGSAVCFDGTGPIAMDCGVALALGISGTPFAASSFWNTPLPDDTPINVNTPAYDLGLTYSLCHEVPAAGALAALTPPPTCSTPTFHGALNTANWSAPLYVVPANQPLVPVQSNGCSNQPNLVSLVVNRAGQPAGVPVPPDAHGSGETNTPDSDTDQEIQIYQPSTDQEWEFWRFAKSSSGAWQACVGGVITSVSQSSGIFASGTGSTATGLPLLGGVVRIEELQAGQINHVMNLSIEDPLSKATLPANVSGATNGLSWPANRGDGGETDSLAIPEGQRFRLNPSLDVNSLSLSPVAKTIAIAAQKYGFVVDDVSSGVSIRLGDPTVYTTAGLTNPYTTGSGVGGVNNGNSGLFGAGAGNMQNFPWDQLQALPFNYGKPGS